MRLPKKLLGWLAAGAAVGMFLNAGVAPIVLTFLEPVSRDLTVETRTEPSPVVLGQGQEQGQEPAEGQLTRTITTGHGEDREQASMQVETTLALDGREALTVDHQLAIDRGSALPVPGTMASYQVNWDGQETRAEEEVVQPGLRYLFPFRPERRSFSYYDPFARTTFPLDYVDEIEVGDLTAYVYSQTIESVPAADVWADLFPEAAGDVEHSTQRVLTIDADTGRLLDVNEFLQLTEGGDGATLYQQQANWDEATKDAAYREAADLNAWLRALQVLAWVGGLVAFGFAVAFAVVLVRYRRALRNLELS